MKAIVAVCATLLVLLLNAAYARAEQVARFTFGTAGSVTRAGFTKITPQDGFTPNKSYGFEDTGGLLAYDRGGSVIERPKDDYTASVYGAYRTTSDLTSGLIEGERDNAFVAAMPDGDYTVWLVASDAEWDPPLFEVWSNGQKRLDVHIPRRAFVYMEPFTARATAGRLRIQLKGKHGWILSGLIIGKEGTALHEVVARAERDIFFLTDQELPNRRERKQAPVNPPLKLLPAETNRGYVLFPADPTEPITPSYVPKRADVGKPITTFAALGQTEAAAFGISANRNVGRVSVKISDLVGEKSTQKILSRNVDLGIVRCRRFRVTGEGPSGEYQVEPDAIEPPIGRATITRAGQTTQWWLTVHVPDNAAPGRYRMVLTITPGEAPTSIVEWRLLVLPFHLSRPIGKHWGTWLESFPPVGGLVGPERRGRNSITEQARISLNDLRDYRDHGFDVALFNYYFGVDEKPDGSFTYDLAGLPRDMAYWKVVGSSAPLIICCEYAFRDIEYRFAEPGKEHVAGAFSPKARTVIVGLVRYIHNEAQRHGWPRLYFAPIDEPGNSKTANRMQFAENVLDLVHQVPGCKTATTVSAGDIQRLGNRVDVRIYAYGNYNRAKALKEEREGHPFWFYENGMFYGHNTIGSRNMTGFEFLRSGAEVATAWGFDATIGNPNNDFDGGHRDWNVVYPGVDRLTPTIYWELCREGADDCRYVATLQEEIRVARAQGKGDLARMAEEVLAPLIDSDARPIENPYEFNRKRWRIAREIIGLRGDKRHVLPFAAVTHNQVDKEVIGPNVISNPSFEDGPKADGFPGGNYQIADQYSTQGSSPIGALSVTTEMAHSGSNCLKWDFGKAQGKGLVYGRDHWLIVNVQVPAKYADSLRGKLVRVGYWFRLGGGSSVPGMTLRQFGKNGYLGGISYAGGIEDPTVWNHFVAEDRLRSDYSGLDIHISCPIPSDPALASKALFYIDDVSLQAIEEPPLRVSTPLEEFYTGESIPWSVTAASSSGQVQVALRLGTRTIAAQTRLSAEEPIVGAFFTRGLAPGIYTVQATMKDAGRAALEAARQIILAPDPFDWR